MKAGVLADLADAKLIFIPRAAAVPDLDGWVGCRRRGGRAPAGNHAADSRCPAGDRAGAKPACRAENGGGTVRTVDEVEALEDAGAGLAVSPHFDASLIAACTRRGLASIPGVLTPTEMMVAWRARATGWKLFPAPPCSAALALRAPLPELPRVAVGGLSKENLGDCLRAACMAGGVGAGVFAPEVTWAEIRQRVAALVRVAQSAVV